MGDDAQVHNAEANHRVIDEHIRSKIEKDYNLAGRYDSSSGLLMPADLVRAIFYQSKFVGNVWAGCDMTYVAANGSTWSGDDFFRCTMNDATFQDSSYFDTVMLDCDVVGGNFTNAVFSESAIVDTRFQGCSFVGAILDHCIFRPEKVEHSTFELASFRHSKLQDIDFRNINLRYCFLENSILKNVSLPYFQIPFIFGGLESLQENKKNVFVSIMNDDAMKASEYLTAELPYLVRFFDYEEEFFPLANCLHFMGEKERAREANEKGLTESLSNADYRMLYFFVLQATRTIRLDREERSQLMQRIDKQIDEANLNLSKQYQLSRYYPKIREALLDNPFGETQARVTMRTNIDADDFARLIECLEFINETWAEAGTQMAGTHIEIRRNSPYVIDFVANGGLDSVICGAQWLGTLAHDVIVSGELQGVGVVANLFYYANRLVKSNPKRLKTHQQARTRASIASDAIEKDERLSDYLKKSRRFKRIREKIRKLDRSQKPGNPQQIPSMHVPSNLQTKFDHLENAGVKISSIDVRFLENQ